MNQVSRAAACVEELFAERHKYCTAHTYGPLSLTMCQLCSMGPLPQPRASEHASKHARQVKPCFPPWSSSLLRLSVCLSPPQEQQGAPLAACNLLPALWASRHRLQLPLLLLCTRATRVSRRDQGSRPECKLSCSQSQSRRSGPSIWTPASEIRLCWCWQERGSRLGHGAAGGHGE